MRLAHTASVAPTATAAAAAAVAELLYPDGIIRWTWVTVNAGYQNSLEELQ